MRERRARRIERADQPITAVTSLHRRQFLARLCAGLISARAGCAFGGIASLDELEKRSGGRLGVAFLDAGSGRALDHRGDERFPLCSTFKLLATAAVLRRADLGAERLDRVINYGKADLVVYSPLTAAHAGAAGGGMSIRALCEAAMTQSDNTAANLLLATLGGPAAVTRFARSVGDGVTRLDRTEPALNGAEAGDERDTTTPKAMVADLRSLLLGERLSVASRSLLIQWMIGCRTGSERLRAGTPSNWAVGDKTGAGDHGTTNEVAIAWPPGRAPVLVAAYLTGSPLTADEREAVLADVARCVFA
jgi:beta-lactamase class A